MRLQTTPADRRQMVREISQHVNTPAIYLRMPTCAYQIGGIIVNRDGTIDCDQPELLETLIPLLLEKGCLTEAPAVETPRQSSPIQERDGESAEDAQLNIRLPLGDTNAQSLRNLLFMLYSEQRLLNKAVGSGLLFIHDDAISQIREAESVSQLCEVMERLAAVGKAGGIALEESSVTMRFPVNEQHPDDGMIFAALTAKIFENCRRARRVHPRVHTLGENEKYQMNSWLNRLGLRGPNFKALRRRMTAGLAGCCAFPDQARAEKHRARYAELRRLRMEGDRKREDEGDERMA
ncbi:MAG: hypothetical protein Q4F18_11130 [Clostridia bacterium]|nr:hypothetical protein [Clostridia bacterium]